MSKDEQFAEWLKEIRAIIDEHGFKSSAHPAALRAMFDQGWGAEFAIMDMIGSGVLRDDN